MELSGGRTWEEEGVVLSQAVLQGSGQQGCRVVIRMEGAESEKTVENEQIE